MKNGFLCENGFFLKNRNICQKYKLLSKIQIFVKNTNYCQKYKFLSKIEFFVKNRIFCQTSIFFVNNLIFCPFYFQILIIIFSALDELRQAAGNNGQSHWESLRSDQEFLWRRLGRLSHQNKSQFIYFKNILTISYQYMAPGG